MLEARAPDTRLGCRAIRRAIFQGCSQNGHRTELAFNAVQVRGISTAEVEEEAEGNDHRAIRLYKAASEFFGL